MKLKTYSTKKDCHDADKGDLQNRLGGVKIIGVGAITDLIESRSLLLSTRRNSLFHFSACLGLGVILSWESGLKMSAFIDTRSLVWFESERAKWTKLFHEFWSEFEGDMLLMSSTWGIALLSPLFFRSRSFLSFDNKWANLTKLITKVSHI